MQLDVILIFCTANVTIHQSWMDIFCKRVRSVFSSKQSFLSTAALSSELCEEFLNACYACALHQGVSWQGKKHTLTAKLGQWAS